MLFTCRQIQEAEQALFATGVDPEPLMDQAGRGIASVVRQFFPGPGTVIPVVGTGHNGGDALVAAAALRAAGWHAIPWLPFAPDSLRPLTRRKLRPFADHVTDPPDLDDLPRPLVFLDGLLGIGATGPLRPEFRLVCRRLNALRAAWNASTVAVDLPTGLDGDSGAPDPDAIVADVTATISHVKQGLVADAATRHVGRLALVPLRELAHAVGDADARVLTARLLSPLWPLRPFDSHKGRFGRVGIIAGSKGLTGAAVMTSSAAVHAGAGLVTLFVPEDIHPIVAGAAIPEVMVRPVADLREALSAPLDILAIGPGLGRSRGDEVLDTFRRFEGPVVLDADGLNLLAEDHLASLPARRGHPTLLTPHPGEMQRLLDADTDAENRPSSRAGQARDFVARHPDSILLLKGARTLVAASGHPLSFNSTGHPGMASGGMGDVLTGICAALAASSSASGQPAHASLHQAACLGAWIAGRAAERALTDHAQSHESVAATETIACLGAAFDDLRRMAF